ncbi:NAD(P)H quinone oxidoreductase, PIG3 family [Backusella circina FSU 941]|nr:NAD(P)H quinone oxidoreductase, PIG3 family [Backusella circina FSU 941]
MRAVIVKQPGDANQLYLGEYETPVPTGTQVLVKVKCFALNRMDIVQRQGFYPPPPGASPLLGVEVSGVIESVGENVTDFKVGDQVFGLMPGGGYAEYALLEQSLTMLKPEKLTFEEAAAIPETWFTAYQALFFVANLKKGQDVLIHAGASGVGIAAIQLAKEAGAGRIFVTVGSDDKVKFCEQLGATKGINYKTEKWDEVILKETGNRGVDIIIDFIGKDYWAQNMNAIALDGKMVILAFMSGAIVDKVDIGPILRKRITVQGSNLRARTVEYQAELRCAIYNNAVLKHFGKDDGVLKVFVDKVFNWEDIVECHKYLESNQSMGKVVVKVTENQ